MKDVMSQGSNYEEEVVEVQEESTVISKIGKKNIIILAVSIVVPSAISVGGVYLTKGKTTKTPKDNKVVESKENPTTETPTNKYAPADIQNLRANGYTADEIEENAKIGTPVAALLQQAADSRKAVLQRQYAELSEAARNSTSPEFQQLMNMTWLSGKPVTVFSDSPNVFTNDEIKFNASYVKVPARGNQLFIRLTIEDGSYIFMVVPPNRWMELKDQGNMVIKYNRIKFGNGYYITNVSEIPI